MDGDGRGAELQMNFSRKWTTIVLAAILACLAGVASINVIVDPYGVFHADPSRRSQSPNLSYLKMNVLLARRGAFDSLLMGSSRVANIDVRNIPGGKWYNLFLAAGLPQEHLQHLRFLLQNGVSIKTVMIGLDDFSFLFDPRDHLSDLDLQPHPDVSGKSLTSFYSEYLFKVKRVFPNIKRFIRESFGGTDTANATDCQFDIVKTGMVLCGPDREQAIERNREGHVTSALFNSPWDYRFLAGPHAKEALAALESIAELARKNNIRLVLFINPIHKLTYLNAPLEAFAQFKRELSDISGYYDFSGLNSVTTNNYYYYETSHYRLLVGDMMLKVMLGEPKVQVPPDFGIFVTRDNVADHLVRQCRELEPLLARQQLSGKNETYASSCDRLGRTGIMIQAGAR